jgi:hypothetical protein
MIEDDDWTEWDSGPVSRPYTVTGGRTRQRTSLRFDLIDLLGRTARPAGDGGFTPERRAILMMCEAPIAVADLASELQLPLGVVRIVLDDLVHDGLIEVRVSSPLGGGAMIDRGVLERVLEGIRALLRGFQGVAPWG